MYKRQEHGLRYIQDESNNVVIFKPAAKGYENAPTVMLQGHMDMVCEKEPGSSHDFTRDALKLQVEGDYISAQGTTLGLSLIHILGLIGGIFLAWFQDRFLDLTGRIALVFFMSIPGF